MTRPRYRADPPSLRRTVALDDAMTLIFHRPSATTHVVAAPVPELLEALGEGPATAGEMLARLAMSYELAASENDEAEIAAYLDELVVSGLAWRA